MLLVPKFTNKEVRVQSRTTGEIKTLTCKGNSRYVLYFSEGTGCWCGTEWQTDAPRRCRNTDFKVLETRFVHVD